MRTHRLLFLCTVYFVCMSFCAKRSFNFSWINVTCTDSPDIFRIVCETAKSENRTVINYWGSVIKDIEEAHVYAYIDVIRIKQDNIRIVESRVDGCEFLKGASEAKMAVVVFKLFEQFGRVPRKCPIIAPNNYSLENVFLDTAYLPAYAPEAVFVSVIQFSTKGVQFFETKIYGKVEHVKNRLTNLLNGRRS